MICAYLPTDFKDKDHENKATKLSRLSSDKHLKTSQPKKKTIRESEN